MLFRSEDKINGLPKFIELPLVCPDEDLLVLDFVFHFIEGFGVGFIAEDDNVNTRLAGKFVRIGLIEVFGRWESDMAGGQKEDSLALAALAEVYGTGALKVRSIFGSDLNAKRGSKGIPDVSNGIFRRVVFKKSWATRLDIKGFPEGYLNVREAGVG